MPRSAHLWQEGGLTSGDGTLRGRMWLGRVPTQGREEFMYLWDGCRDDAPYSFRHRLIVVASDKAPWPVDRSFAIKQTVCYAQT